MMENFPGTKRLTGKFEVLFSFYVGLCFFGFFFLV